MGKSYDPNEDYKKKMDEAAAAGDYQAAARYEQQRNAKIQGEGLTQYQTTNQYGQYLPMEKPAAPQQTWQGEMEQTLQEILNRKPFSYDVNADALYQQYARQYAEQGRLAMEDTMGKAAALTGGYGNSYAQSVGQQTYNDYMGRLNDMVPELEQRAYQRYQAEGDALLDRYSLMQNAQDREYSRYQDQLAEYYNQLDRKEAAEREERDRTEAAEGEERNRAYSLALQMLQSGMMPSDALLSLAGISAEDAQRYVRDRTEATERDRTEAAQAEERDRAYSLALQMLQSGMMPSDALLSLAGISAEDAQKIYNGSTASYSGSYGGGGVGSYDGGASGVDEWVYEQLSEEKWAELFQLYQKGMKNGDLSAYYSQLANYSRQYDIGQFEGHMVNNVTDYEEQGNVIYGKGMEESLFSNVLRTMRYSSVEKIMELAEQYSGQMSKAQWGEVERLLKQRRVLEP